MLLIIWSCDTSTKYELVELFAGKGNVGREWRLDHGNQTLRNFRCTNTEVSQHIETICPNRSAGRAVGQFDWDYCPAGMNFTGNGGFACMAQIVVWHPEI